MPFVAVLGMGDVMLVQITTSNFATPNNQDIVPIDAG